MVSNKQESDVFNFMPDINPEWTRLQRIRGTATESGMNFSALRPIPRALLSSRSYIKWSFQVTRTEDGGASNFMNAQDQAIFVKPFLLLANCTQNVTLSINGYGMEYREPRYWSKYIGYMEAKRQYYNTLASGGPVPLFNGAYDLRFRNSFEPVIEDGTNRTDPHINTALDLAFKNYLTAVDDNVGNRSAIATFEFLDPLYFGPFNPFFGLRRQLKDDSLYKSTSNTIPYVHQLELNIKLNRIIANCLQFPYSLRNVPNPSIVALERIENVTAELVLEWIVPKPSILLQPRIDIPTFEVDFKSFELNDGNAIDDDLDIGTTTTISTDTIHYRQIPSFILIAAVRDKDDPLYECTAVYASDVNDGTGQVEDNRQENSWEPTMNIDDITLTTNINNRFIDNRWNQREIFQLTSKNCKQIPFNYSSFAGGSSQYSQQPSNVFLLVKPDDISLKQSTGMRRNDFTIQIDATLRTRTGFSINREIIVNGSRAVGLYNYKLIVVSFYTQTFITIGKDRRVERRLVTQFI